MQDSHEKTTLKYVYRKAYKDFFILLETFFCMYIYIYIYIVKLRVWKRFNLTELVTVLRGLDFRVLEMPEEEYN
jgi:hypothetical protein